jgi:hypothetical protein
VHCHSCRVGLIRLHDGLPVPILGGALWAILFSLFILIHHKIEPRPSGSDAPWARLYPPCIDGIS